MPSLHSRARIAAACCAFGLTIVSAAEATAKSTPGDLRVVTPNGWTIAEHRQYTSTTQVETSKRADCFGQGTGGSGERATVRGSTALGILDDAKPADRDVRPLLVTDFFDFGLGLCGIGGFEAPSTGYWYLKVNHVGSTTGGDQTRVRNGDDVLWYLIEDFSDPTPNELVLDAPDQGVDPGEEIPVRVTEREPNGDRSPAVGADVKGALLPTDLNGRTTVAVPDRGKLGIRATLEDTIPSNRETVCGAGCKAGFAGTIAGTAGNDRIRGSQEADTILAGKGRDRINARPGSAVDKVDCGGGRDRLKIERGQEIRKISCERITRR